MNGILILRKEHQDLEKLMMLTEEILDEEELNSEELKVNLEKIFSAFDVHERKEDSFFKEISKFSKEMRDSLDEINMVHDLLKGHIKVLKKALSSDDKEFLRAAVENDGRMLFSQLREHMHKEEKVFDSILFLNLLKSRAG